MQTTLVERAKSFLAWAFVISIVAHFALGGLIPFKPYRERDTNPEVVTVDKKRPPPPLPTPRPPTPAPKLTPPLVRASSPPQRHVQPHVAPQSNNRDNSTQRERPFSGVGPSSPDGIPPGNVASAAPAPTAAAPASEPATPLPTPRPSCAVPNKEAATTRAVQPDYPDIARQQGAAGTTQVKVSLSATGAVLGTAVYRSSGNAALDSAALAAARASAYSPEIENCERVPGSYLFQADFTGQVAGRRRPGPGAR